MIYSYCILLNSLSQQLKCLPLHCLHLWDREHGSHFWTAPDIYCLPGWYSRFCSRIKFCEHLLASFYRNTGIAAENKNRNFYSILSSEINAYQKQIKVISITSEMMWYQSLVIDISLYFHCSVFWITSDFSIHLMQLTSKVQMPITSYLWTKTSSVGSHFLS